jgi:PAS domain S-box-containing protein
VAGVDSQLRAGRDRVVLDALPALTSGLAVLQTLIAVVHATLGSAAERPFVYLDLASAALALSVRLALGRGAISARWAHPFAFGCAAVAAAIVLLHLWGLGDPLQSLMLVLVLVGSGSILLSFPWFNLLATASLAGWLAVIASLGEPPGSLRLGIALLGSWAVGAMILAARLRSLFRLEELRTENEARLTRDVAEARRLTETAHQAAESHRLLFEKSPLPMWVVDRAGLNFLAVNEATIDNYGYSRDEFLEMTLEDVHPPEDIPTLLADLASENAERTNPRTRRHRRKDGTLIDVEIVAHDTAFGEWDAILAVLIDVTERRRSEAALRRSQESFERLFEGAPMGMAMVDANRRFAQVNRALCHLLGYSKEELLALPFDAFIAPRDLHAHLQAAHEFFENERSSFKLEARYLPKEGTPLWGSLSVERIEDSTGQMLFVLAMLEDISERRRAAEEREHIILELKDALAKVKTLRGLVPICASCKKVRDDKGYWSQVEVYVRDRTEAEFSHGICPDCMKKLYGR